MADTQPPMAHEDSVDSQDPNQHPDNKEKKSRRPANTAFRQQRLKAWQPILTPKTVLPLFFAIGVIFAPIGGGLLFASAVVQEKIIDYSSCYTDAPDAPDWGTIPSGNVMSHFTKNDSQPQRYDNQWQKNVTTFINKAGVETNTTECFLKFGIDNTMKHPILFYYKLTNFYQNHRRYAKSFSTDQLSGKAVSIKDIKGGDCDPLDVNKTTNLPYYPCGLAANSLFNDTFFSPVLQNPRAIGNTPTPNETEYTMTNKGISWVSDRQLYGDTKYAWDAVTVPPNWVETYGDHYTNESHPDLVNDEEFQVWMRLAGLPTFSKLAQRNDTTDMEAGQYVVKINHNFPVTEYGGTKSIVISTRTVMGGKNPFLGIAYVIVGGICIILGALFTVTHLIRPRKLGDHTYLSWNNENANSGNGVSTGARDGVLAGEGRA